MPATFWFGRWKGEELFEVDTPYLLWALRKVELTPKVRQAVLGELSNRGVPVIDGEPSPGELFRPTSHLSQRL